MGKNKKKGSKGPKANVFKVAGAKSLKKNKAKAVNLGLKNGNLQTAALLKSKFKRSLGDPIKYQRKPGSRRYMEYTNEELRECIAAIKSKQLTQRDAAEQYNIPRSTIKNKMSNKPSGVPGRVPIFSEEEEELFATRIWALSEFGFPLTNYDIKMIVKDYLASQNRTITEFKNNLPGKDWLKFFFDRHKVLCKHLEKKYDKIRGQISISVIGDFIEHVAKVTDDIPPENIYSYYELSFGDDAKKKIIVSKRGTKYPETVKNSLKPRFSAMFCGNAAGEVLPPYIIYKAEHRCSTWIENGPKGAHYNCTKHGWIDMVTFENWFLVHLLPNLKKRSGQKVLIGDNLSSHISGKVLAYCEKYDIRFICLPYKSNSILHPLDMVYLRPMKSMWTQIILDWRINQVAQKQPTALSGEFPYFLKVALNTFKDIKRYLIMGFEKTGIYPINVSEPISRLPRTLYQPPISLLDSDDSEDDSADDAANESANESANDSVNESANDSANGSAIDPAIDPANDSDNDSQSSFSQKIEPESPKSECSNDPNDLYLVIVQGGEVFQFRIIEEESTPNISVGDHVLVNKGHFQCPGKVTSVSNEGAYVYCMKRWKSLWRWPTKMSRQLYSWEEILCTIDVPKLVERGCYEIPELNDRPSDDISHYCSVDYNSQ